MSNEQMERAKELIRERVKCTDFLVKDPAGAPYMYCCPFCESGSGNHGTGAMKYYPDTNKAYCHKCKKSADVFDLYQKQKGVDFMEAMRALAPLAGVDLAAGSGPAGRTAAVHTKPAPSMPPVKKMPKQHTRSREEEERARKAIAEKLQEWATHATEPDSLAFWEARGIGPEWLDAFEIGYNPQERRVIIPTENSYVARSIDPGEGIRYKNAAGGDPGGFNMEALEEAEPGAPVFICEGAIDAISVMQAGGYAVGLNSVSRYDKLLAALEKKPTQATLVLTLDNDAAGEQARQQLEDGLTRLNIPYTIADICGGHNDPNEAATADMATFKENVREAMLGVKRPDNTHSYIDRIMAGEILKFKQAGNRKTGFPDLDKAIQGIYAGLYVVAASPGLGKTTLCLQLADQMAALGETVLFFTLEMSRLEMVSKSIARTARQLSPGSKATSLSIRRGEMPPEVLEAAAAYQKNVGDRISMIEGNFRCDIKYIENYVREFVRKNNTRPVVFIDYLQILQGDPDRHTSAKDNVDNTVTTLKRMSREMDIPVFVISSINRGSYLHGITYESLKESGGIEYTADCVLGLQFQVMGDRSSVFYQQSQKGRNVDTEKQDALEEAKAEPPRKIQLKCLKNRYGNPSFSCFFDYDQRHDLFSTGAPPLWYIMKQEQKKMEAQG